MFWSCGLRLLEKFSASSLRVECQAYVALLAGPRENRDSRESWIAKAARPPKLTVRMIKSLYYGEISDPEHPAVKLLRDAADAYRLQSILNAHDQLGRLIRSLIENRAAGAQGQLPF